MSSTYQDIVKELFSPSGAIEKCAKARHAYYEITLWQRYGLPIYEISSASQNFFRLGFLGGKAIGSASKKELKSAISRLFFAAGGHSGENTGCIKRCLNLIAQLEACADSPGEPGWDQRELVDWLTFSSRQLLGMYGQPIMEPGRNFPVQVWQDKQHRDKFKRKLNTMIEAGRLPSLSEVYNALVINQKG